MEWTMTGGVPGQICLMQGNEAIVRGAVEAGIHFAASYPGSPSSQVLGMLGKIARERGFYAEWSTNEVCALQACTGASLAGGRALCVVKQNGLLCVADALHCAAQAGVKGGLVIVSSDDPSAHSSTNEFDSRWQAMSAGIPLLEPTTMQEAKDMIPYAFDLSEKVGQIVLIRVTTRVCHGRGNVTLGPLPEKLRPLERVKEWDRMVCVSYMHGPALQKLEKLRGLFEDSPCNHYEGPEAPKKLVIAGGTGRLYGQEALRRLGMDRETGFMALGTLWPLPENYILPYLRAAEEVLILEEVDPFLERAVQALAGREGLSIRFLGRDNALPAVGELDPDVVTAAICRLTGAALPEKKATGELELPVREMSFCAGCPHRATFYLLKRAMRQEKHPGVVVGDIGCYFMAGQSAGQYAWQTCNCMGSGVSVAEGLGQLTNYGLDQKVVTMCGDSTFFHTILPGLVNATYHNANMLLIVLDNSATAMTGFQPHPGTGLTAMGDQVKPMDIPKILGAVGCNVEVADPFEVVEAEKTLRRMLDQPGMNVLIMRQPCATLMTKERSKKPVRVYVDQDVCIGDGCGCDKYCSRVWGCPGNTWDFKKNKALIDPVTCVGCGVCAKLCPSGAIKVDRGEEA
ncbi:thiamine pyrophosphate-dependent enzyme [uncultured Oscillibacter sp.]|uniref:thiamine pyrophosphate-dependent enzyme n=2 Tax=Oscillibacter TaxID=459786 RepID=UPI002619210D|nr:thiamine pyrophosphate-dependent enzyme [uncultured Oscillibacter sp.]